MLPRRKRSGQAQLWSPELRVLTELNLLKTRPSWLNCALRDDEAVYWVSIGQFEAVAVGD